MARQLQQDRFPAPAWQLVGAGFAAFGRGAKKIGLCRLGATAVEFGMVAPLFLAMTMGLMEMGRAMWIQASLQYAVERATRGYMVDNNITTSELEDDADGFLAGVGVNPATSPFTAILDNSTTPDTMSISGSYSFEVIVPFVPFPDVTLTVKSSVRANS